MKHDAAAAQKYRRCLVPHAQQQRRPLDEDVELDDGDSFGGAEGFSFGLLGRQAWAAVQGATDRLTDVVYDYVPEEVSRTTVSLAVKTALLLILVGFARSILGFVLTVGTVVLGLFVASRVLGIEAGGKDAPPRGKRGKSDGRWGSGGSRVRQRGEQSRPPRRLPSGIAKDNDVLDVWFETKDAERDRRQR